MSYKAACTAIAAAAALALGGTAAHAGTDANAVQKAQAVQVADLDLSTSEGRAELQTRLDRAARDVCGMSEKTTGSRLPSKAARKCLRETQAKMTVQFAHLLDEESRGG